MHSGEAHRLVHQKSIWKTGPFLDALRLVVDESYNGLFTEVYRIVVDDTLNLAGSERCPSLAFLNCWQYQSIPLQYMPHEVRRMA